MSHFTVEKSILQDLQLPSDKKIIFHGRKIDMWGYYPHFTERRKHEIWRFGGEPTPPTYYWAQTCTWCGAERPKKTSLCVGVMMALMRTDDHTKRRQTGWVKPSIQRGPRPLRDRFHQKVGRSSGL